MFKQRLLHQLVELGLSIIIDQQKLAIHQNFIAFRRVIPLSMWKFIAFQCGYASI